MNGLTPEALRAIIKAVSTLYRESILEVGAVYGEPRNLHQSRTGSDAVCSLVVGGAILMLARAVDGQANESREFMYSIDGRLNQLNNDLLELTKAVEHGVRVSDSEREALRLVVQSGLESIRDELGQR